VRAFTMFVVSTAGSNPNKMYIKSMLVKYGSNAIYGRLLRALCRDGISVCFSFVYLHVGRDVYWGSYNVSAYREWASLAMVTISERKVRLQCYEF
jgi:hypothetical protein